MSNSKGEGGFKQEVVASLSHHMARSGENRADSEQAKPQLVVGEESKLSAFKDMLLGTLEKKQQQR